MAKPTRTTKITRGPFKGQTSQKIIQTVDIGTNTHKGFKKLADIATNSPNRTYSAVDPLFRTAEDPKLHYIRLRENHLIPDNLIISDKQGLIYLQELKERGIKVRHINFEMPYPNLELYNFNAILGLVPTILMPNGKIYIHSEHKGFIDKISELAKRYRYATKISNLDEKTIQQMRAHQKLSDFAELYVEDNYWTLEITYSLRTAIPDKNKRQNWPK